ncbi:site-specific integrase [Alkalibacillus aidingensis]|uniref:site-specific integrase n=1 Tax=Alkalibacillus aidingensis TaxID=2747607 RepID=UPI0016602215|nr:site-specific integrase [Alkalibacillus aidingensis]
MNQSMIETFIQDHQARFSQETMRSYQISLHQFFSFCDKPFDEVKPTDIRAWLSDMESNELKPRTIHVKLSVVKSFYQYCT